jgi:hypothetical protein
LIRASHAISLSQSNYCSASRSRITTCNITTLQIQFWANGKLLPSPIPFFARATDVKISEWTTNLHSGMTESEGGCRKLVPDARVRRVRVLGVHLQVEAVSGQDLGPEEV